MYKDTSVKRSVLLVAEDDPDDQLLISDAFHRAEMKSQLVFVNNGNELLRYLRGVDRDTSQIGKRPSLILLDLNMPGKDGRQALKEIKQDPTLCSIPVIVLTTSMSREDIRNVYASGGNAYIVKPAQFGKLIEIFRVIRNHWFEVAKLPNGE